MARRTRNSSRLAPLRCASGAWRLRARSSSGVKSASTKCGCAAARACKAGSPSLTNRSRQPSTCLCCRASSSEIRFWAPRLASISVVSSERINLPMYCRWRASPPWLEIRCASSMASRSGSGKVRASRSAGLSAISRSPSFCARSASRLRELLLGFRSVSSSCHKTSTRREFRNSSPS